MHAIPRELCHCCLYSVTSGTGAVSSSTQATPLYMQINTSFVIYSNKYLSAAGILVKHVTNNGFICMCSCACVCLCVYVCVRLCVRDSVCVLVFPSVYLTMFIAAFSPYLYYPSLRHICQSVAKLLPIINTTTATANQKHALWL